MDYAFHCGLGAVPLCGDDPVGTHWADEPEPLVG